MKDFILCVKGIIWWTIFMCSFDENVNLFLAGTISLILAFIMIVPVNFDDKE